jgi:hypothetical protein
MKTKIISVTSSAIIQVLKTCQDQQIKCTYLTLRENNEVVMELAYNITQENLIHQLTDYLEQAAEGAEHMKEVITDMIEKSEEPNKEPLRIFFESIKFQVLQPFKY